MKTLHLISLPVLMLACAVTFFSTGCTKSTTPSGPAGGLEAFHSDVLQADKLVLVDFWAPWCGPCRYMTPILEKLTEENVDKLKLVKVNTDIEEDVALYYRIEALPTLMLFKGGKVLDVKMGAMQAGDLLDWVSPHL